MSYVSTMIRPALIISCFLFICSFSYAQFGLGVMSGVNISDLDYSHPEMSEGTKSITSVHFGVMPQYTFEDRFIAGLGLNYESKGTGSDVSGGKFRYRYLDIEPTFFFAVHDHIQIGGGPYIGLLLSDQVSFDNEWRDITELVSRESIDLGLRATIRAIYKNFFISGAYEFGLKDTYSGVSSDVFGNPIGTFNEKNRNIQLSAGYIINI